MRIWQKENEVGYKGVDTVELGKLGVVPRRYWEARLCPQGCRSFEADSQQEERVARVSIRR